VDIARKDLLIRWRGTRPFVGVLGVITYDLFGSVERIIDDCFDAGSGKETATVRSEAVLVEPIGCFPV
jgi:hypothetical protein